MGYAATGTRDAVRDGVTGVLVPPMIVQIDENSAKDQTTAADFPSSPTSAIDVEL